MQVLDVFQRPGAGPAARCQAWTRHRRRAL